MKKQNLLLSLLFALVAVMMTSCSNNGTSENKIVIDSNQQTNTPSLVIVSSNTGSMEYSFNAELKNAGVEDYNFYWQFGDGSTSSEASTNVTHKYETGGVYTVNLTLNKKDGSSQITSSTTVYVTKFGFISNVSLVYQSEQSSADNSYVFTASAKAVDGAVLNYQWNFGDGSEVVTESTGKMSHSFEKYGKSYTVTVKIIHSVYTEETIQKTVTVSTPKISANLSVDNTLGNARLKSFTIDFNGVKAENLVNAKYIWNYGNGVSVTTTNNINQYEYPAESSESIYDVSVLISSDSFDGNISVSSKVNITNSFILSDSSYSALNNNQLEYKYTISGLGSGAVSGNVIYRFTFPNNTKPVDVQGVLGENGSSYAEITHNYTNYLSQYDVFVEAGQYSASGVFDVWASKTITHNFQDPEFSASAPSISDNNLFARSFSLSNSYEPANAVYTWNFGDGTNKVVTDVPYSSHIYSAKGNYEVIVSVKISGADWWGSHSYNYTVDIDDSVAISSIVCYNRGEIGNFLSYSCSSSASTSAGNVSYIWTLDDKVVADENGKDVILNFTKYNEQHILKVKAVIDGTTIESVEQVYTISTPKPVVEISGKTQAYSGERVSYTANIKVVDGSSSMSLTLDNANYEWIINNQPVSYSGANIMHQFNMDDKSNASENKTVKVIVSADSMAGSIERTINVTLTSPPASMTDISSLTVSCAPINDYNKVKQNCYVIMNLKDGAPSNFDYTRYSAKVSTGNVSSVAEFNSSLATVPLVLDWPEINSTGETSVREYSVNVSVYKTDAPNEVMTATATAVVVNNVDYVLFPLPSKATSGGSGSRFGTYSCGYNEKYGYSSVTNYNCGPYSAKTNSTLNLQDFVDNNGYLRATLKFRWGYNIKTIDGVTYTGYISDDYKVAQIGTKPDSNVLVFDAGTAFRNKGIKYSGGAYNSNNANNVFFLEISSDDKDVLAKPLKISYNGKAKTEYSNRLQVISATAPESSSISACEMTVTAGSMWNPPVVVTGLIDKGIYHFDNTGLGAIIPTGANKPALTYKLWFSGNGGYGEILSEGVNSSAVRVRSDEYKGYFLEETTSGTADRWYFKKTLTGGGTFSGAKRAEMGVQIKNMLSGSGGETFSNYYKPISCKINQ